MSDWRNDDNVDVKVEKEFDANIGLDFDLKVDIEKDVNVDVKVESDADIKDNVAQFNIDVEAFGDNTFTELDLFVLTTDDSSSIVASGISAVD